MQQSPLTQQLERQLTLTINGEPVSVKDSSPATTLLEYLRLSGRAGTKEGCGDGDCGACTVAIIGDGADGQPHYQAVNSCLIPLGAVAGRQVFTADGITQCRIPKQSFVKEAVTADKLHPVQSAMVETGGSQCGYCTPGFIMSLFAAYYDGTPDDMSVEGNLCRCTGYLPIRRAAQMVADATAQDEFSEQLKSASTALVPLAYTTQNNGHSEQFYRPAQLSDVFELMQQYPDATLVAGATDLGLEMSWHRQHFPVLISLEAVEELKQVRQSDEVVEVGAAVPLSHIETNLHGIFPCMDEMIHWFAARQVRNRATLGGNIGTASPIGDLPPVLLALNASVKLASPSGERTVLLADFFTGYRQTELQSDEVIVSVQISKTLTPGTSRRLTQAYKIGKRGTDDISIVAAAFVVDVDDSNQILHARLGYGGVAATPARAIAVENFLVGKPWSAETIQAVKPLLQDAFSPLTDLRGSANYRKRLVVNLFEKFSVEFP
ncbi:MAG: xanthine dehydrogenase small subunit [Nodosilinea sp.]